MAKKKIIIPVILGAAAVAAALFFGIRAASTANSPDAGSVYLNSVLELREQGNNDGSITRFLGVVQAQDTWKLAKDSEKSVSEIYVSEGDTVQEGSLLLKYDVSKAEQDLAAAQIELERMDSELANYNTSLANLQSSYNNAQNQEERDKYSLEIQDMQLQIQEKQLDRQSKVLSMDTLQDTINNSQVTSPIAGVVKSLDTSDSSSTESSEDDNSLIVIMKTGDYQVKASVDEMTIGQVMEGASMIIVSRADSTQRWTGTVSKIDTENTDTSGSNDLYDSGLTSSTNYPFYIQLDSSEGLLLGQHVYVETDQGQMEESEAEELWLSSEYLQDITEEKAWVWAESDNGTLEKRDVTLGDYNEELDKYEILSGLTDEDYIAIPSDDGEEEEYSEETEALHDY